MTAAAVLAGFRALRRKQGVPIVYRRQTESAELVGVLGVTLHDVADAQGVLTTWESQDVLVEASQLVLGGTKTKPREGDEIHLTLEGEAIRLCVQFPDGGRPPFKYSDAYRQLMRIHTAQTGSSPE